MSTGTEVIGLQTLKRFRPELHHRSGFNTSYGKPFKLTYQVRLIEALPVSRVVRLQLGLPCLEVKGPRQPVGLPGPSVFDGDPVLQLR